MNLPLFDPLSASMHKGAGVSKVIKGDCNDLLATIKTASVDLIATDPPYEIGFEKHGWDVYGGLNWAFLAAEFERVLKPTGTLIVFQGWSNVCETKAVLDGKLTLKNWIIYDRIKGRGSKTNLVSTREDILWYVKDENDYTYNKISSTIRKKTGGSIGKKNGNPFRALSNVWTDISPIVPWSKERVCHPTQKPLDIMLRIVEIFSNDGDVVLDPFCGSGTTGVAAKKMNRAFIGFEKDAAYCDISRERLSSHD
ncbi:MAG: DNA-methyltransferase [Gammaproteobacteria bacterium]